MAAVAPAGERVVGGEHTTTAGRQRELGDRAGEQDRRGRRTTRAIEVAARGVQEDVIGRTRVALETAGALRSQSGEEDGPAGSGSSERTATVSGR